MQLKVYDSVARTVNAQFREMRHKNDEQDLEIQRLQTIIGNEKQKLIKTRKALASNVIIRGMAETDNESNSDARRKVEEVLCAMNAEVEIEKVERKGKRNEDRPRIIKMTTANNDQRNEFSLVASEGKTLRQSPKFRNIYIDADKPVCDRKESARLRIRAREIRNADPDSEVKLFRGKLYVNGSVADFEDPLRHLFPSH